MAYNAADPEQVEERKQKEKRGRERELEDMQKLLALPEFRRFAWRYLGKCKVFETVFNSHGGLMNLNEGMRTVGLMMLDDITQADPQAYIAMTVEAKQRGEAQE